MMIPSIDKSMASDSHIISSHETDHERRKHMGDKGRKGGDWLVSHDRHPLLASPPESELFLCN